MFSIPKAENIRFESELMAIGKHEWKVIVYYDYSPYWTTCLFTGFLWRVAGETWWRPERDWPHYNFNDGTYGGLPKTLGKLYQANITQIKFHLAGGAQPKNKQVVQGSLSIM